MNLAAWGARRASDLLTIGLSRPSTVRLPASRVVELPGRGPVHVWEAGGPPGAPTLFLLHGLMATGGLNWFPAINQLSADFRVVALDLRGHGRSMHVGSEFHLADCADDVAALADRLGVERFFVCGYSLGGPVAQLVWHRHRDRVQGLVLCATSRNIGGSTPERAFFSLLLGGIVGLRVANWLRRPFGSAGPGGQDPVATERGGGGAGPGAGPADADVAPVGRPDSGDPDAGGDPRLAQWALSELRRADPLTMVTAVAMMGRFSSHVWAGDIDVPTAVVVTTQDHLISTGRQMKLAEAIPGATVHRVAAGHAACVVGAREFVPALSEACRSVAERSGALPSRPGAGQERSGRQIRQGS